MFIVHGDLEALIWFEYYRDCRPRSSMFPNFSKVEKMLQNLWYFRGTMRYIHRTCNMTPTDFATTETEFCVILQHLGPLFLCHTDNISDNISDIKSNKSIIHIQFTILYCHTDIKSNMSNYPHTIFNFPYCHTDIKSIISIFLMTTVAFASPHTITQQAKRKQIRSSQRSLQRCQDAAGIKLFQPLYMTWESHV